ncbi:MAG: redox-sensing transcriptional repressor Rex [Candidatus Zixiibacteriota bacterium]
MNSRRTKDARSEERAPAIRRRISESTIHRLSIYFRALTALEAEGYHTVSSKDLARREKLTPAQVRKDLSFFGSFGTRGLGYPTRELRARIGSILGIDRHWNVGLIGAGNIGSALVSYKEFHRQGFAIKAIFDNDQRKIGSNHKGIIISDINDLAAEIKKKKLEIVVLAVPAAVAQKACDLAVSAGIRAILNFAPINLKVPKDVMLRTENMAMEMEYLSYFLTNRPVESPE